MVMQYIPTFNEDACREAILNAVAHRDYRHPGSVWVRQFPRHIEIVSPGGFPEGITAENLLDRQSPRNRLLADAMHRCGFVERAGQGADKMFRTCIREGKALPDYSDTDAHQVGLVLNGQVRDPQFVKFLEKVSTESGESWGLHELLVLTHVHDNERIPERLAPALARLLDTGVVERLARNRLVLSRRVYSFVGRPGEYTRRRGLDHETNKELLLKHIRDCGAAGARMEELAQVLPSKSTDQIKRLLHELREDRLVHKTGLKRWTRWYTGSEQPSAIGAKTPKER